jgi:hypothetical protein
MTQQKLKRILFRRGGFPMGDLHDMLGRVRDRLEEMEAQLVEKHQLRAAETEESLKERFHAFFQERVDGFFKLVREEMDAQWDRIVDRRVLGWFYAGIGPMYGVVVIIFRYAFGVQLWNPF